MITIEFLNEEIEGEPGPNFYWRGEPADYLRLLNDMHEIGRKVGIEFDLNEISYIRLRNLQSIRTISSHDGKLLCKKEDETVLINLPCPAWQEVLQGFLIISFCPSHTYIDLEGFGLLEDANFIVSSEG